MSPISIHLHRRYQSGAKISMLTLPLKEVNMVTQTNEQFRTILSIVLPSGGRWETNDSVNTHNFVKIHLKKEKGKRVERLAGLGSRVIQSLDLKSLKLLICDKKNDVPGSKSKPVWPKSFIECKKALVLPHL